MSIIKSEIFEAIFGPEFCQQIEQEGELYSKLCWQIGKRTVWAIAELSRVKGMIVRGELTKADNPYIEYILSFGMMDIYLQMATRYGIPQRTIRHYAEIARFYTNEQIWQFEVLPFAHFKFAKSCGEQHAIRILELALRQMDRNNGKPPSVDWLETAFYNAAGNPEQINDVEAAMNFDDAGYTAMTAQRQPLPQPIFYFVRSAKRLFESVSRQFQNADVEPEVKERVDEIFERLSSSVDELVELFELEQVGDAYRKHERKMK